MADANDKMNGRTDERVYPGAPSLGTDGSVEVCGEGSRISRSQVLARAVLAVSLLLVVGSGAYFALRPSPEAEVQRAGSAAIAADADDAPADADRGSSGADRGGEAKGSVAEGGDTGKVDGPSGASDAPDGGAQGQSTAAPGPSGGSDSSASGQAPSGQQTVSPQAPATISVRVAVDSSSVGGSVSANTTVELAPSSTAYDALCATGLSVNSRNSAFGSYVAGIGGLSEFDHGGASGWKYKVNGDYPSHSASAFELHDGDSVVWVYVTG